MEIELSPKEFVQQIWKGIDGLKPVPIFYSDRNNKNRARFVIHIDKLDSVIALYGRFREKVDKHQRKLF